MTKIPYQEAGEVKCEVEGCSSTFSKASNLKKHVKAVHKDIRPFVCGFPDCGMRFAYKQVRNNPKNSASHAYTCICSYPTCTFQVIFVPNSSSRISHKLWFQGDFVETDEVFTSRSRCGLKRKQVTAEEMLIRKRVMSLQFDSEEHESC